MSKNKDYYMEVSILLNWLHQIKQDEVQTNSNSKYKFLWWKNTTISDECIKMAETKKPVEVTELINYHFPFTEKIKFVLH